MNRNQSMSVDSYLKKFLYPSSVYWNYLRAYADIGKEKSYFWNMKNKFVIFILYGSNAQTDIELSNSQSKTWMDIPYT